MHDRVHAGERAATTEQPASGSFSASFGVLSQQVGSKALASRSIMVLTSPYQQLINQSHQTYNTEAKGHDREQRADDPHPDRSVPHLHPDAHK